MTKVCFTELVYVYAGMQTTLCLMIFFFQNEAKKDWMRKALALCQCSLKSSVESPGLLCLHFALFLGSLPRLALLHGPPPVDVDLGT